MTGAAADKLMGPGRSSGQMEMRATDGTGLLRFYELIAGPGGSPPN